MSLGIIGVCVPSLGTEEQKSPFQRQYAKRKLAYAPLKRDKVEAPDHSEAESKSPLTRAESPWQSQASLKRLFQCHGIVCVLCVYVACVNVVCVGCVCMLCVCVVCVCCVSMLCVYSICYAHRYACTSVTCICMCGVCDAGVVGILS